MTANVGKNDRILRALIGLTFIGLVFIGPFAGLGWGRISLAVVGGVLLLTSVVKFCPLYGILGIQTCAATEPGLF